jgi:flagellar basal-body rod protein FlgC
MGMFDAIDVSGSGLSAESLRMDIVAENLANADSTAGVDGKPYQRQEVQLQAAPGGPSFGQTLDAAMGSSSTTTSTNTNGQPGGVRVTGIVSDTSAPRQVYDPGNPAANKQGYVQMPNVNSVEEMTDLIDASRAYEANVTSMQTDKTMFTKTLSLLQ